VACRVVGGNRGTGEDELPRHVSPVVDRTSDRVPDIGYKLPFVDEPWDIAGQEQGRVEETGLASSVLAVQADDGVGSPKPGLGLSTSARTFDEHCTRGSKACSQLRVNDPRSVIPDLAWQFHPSMLGAQM
jgi:hypothetical protein